MSNTTNTNTCVMEDQPVCTFRIFNVSILLSMKLLSVKVSLNLVNGSFGANGDNEWRQWMLHCRQWRFGEWRQWRSQSPLAPMATSIGANGDRHWRPLAPFKWRHLIHSMAILRSQSPFRVSGSFGDPMAPIDPVAPLTTMVIHLRQWHQLRQWGQWCHCQWRQWSKWR